MTTEWPDKVWLDDMRYEQHWHNSPAMKGSLYACHFSPPYIRADLVPQWLPIESAPKDRSRILVSHGSNGACVVYWSDSFDLWMTTGGNFIRDITHWMPLPPPPET